MAISIKYKNYLIIIPCVENKTKRIEIKKEKKLEEARKHPKIIKSKKKKKKYNNRLMSSLHTRNILKRRKKEFQLKEKLKQNQC